MSRRAVSPVIAVILLVGVAVGAAALAYSWYSGVQRGVQDTSGAVGPRTMKSATSSLVILNKYYNGSALNLSVKNIGGSNQTGLKLYIDDEQYANMGDKSIGVGEVGNVWNNNVVLSPRVHTIKVISREGAEGSITF